jgi:hypothetical protein
MESSGLARKQRNPLLQKGNIMRKVFIALLVTAGLMAGAMPAQAGTKWQIDVNSVTQKARPKLFAAPKHLLAAPSTKLFKSKTCSAGDTGYRVVVEVDYTVIGGKVDINSVYSQYMHRKLGLWGISDWASSSTDTIQNAGNTWGSLTRNPVAKNNWYPSSPAFTPNGLRAGVLKASGSGTALRSAGCFIALP